MTIKDLIADDRNANKGTARGNEALKVSLKKYGGGRSILIDKNFKIIAGNKTAANAQAAGLKNVLVVPTDGKELIAVQRTDIDLDSKKGRELAIADNRTSELGLEWDAAVLGSFEDLDLQPFFTNSELLDIGAAEIDFLPGTEGDQGKLDSKKEICCPECGCMFNA